MSLERWKASLMPAGTAEEAGFLDRTLGNLRRGWRDIAASLGMARPPEPSLPESDIPDLLARMQDCLTGKGGEVSARARAAALGRDYLGLNEEGRGRFLRLLAEQFDVVPVAVEQALERLRQARGDDAWQAALREARAAMVPARLRLLTQFNALPDGVKFLVDMRAEVMRRLRAEPILGGLEADLKELLANWFDIGFLELRRVTWDSPASLLEKLIAYEAVHEIQSWDDLKNRLDADRRMFAFFHPRMPDEPLIFVEVALVNGMADNIHALLDQHAPVLAPAKADTAIFYSISNAQKGLAGISFGNFLIKRVVDSLRADMPGLKTFATLSPIPGFRPWLGRRLEDVGDDLLLPAERKRLAIFADGESGESGGVLRSVLARADWPATEAAEALEGPLKRLCARYLADERRRGGQVLDPVAHFHLSNGARMERLNWLADTSAKGMSQSAGLMINYLYRLNDIEGNHEAYSGDGKVAMSSGLRALLK